MDDSELRRRYAQVFDGVAEDYDRERRSYPHELIDTACRRGGLGQGDVVVEVGCGTGHLTAALLERGLRVEAVDPGANMIRLAARRVGDSPAVTFHRRKFEDVALPESAFAAVFSATAFHWIEPVIGWAKAASLLRPGGMLALIQHSGTVRDEHTTAIEDALHAGLAKVAPGIAAHLPRPHDASSIMSGASQRRDNISEVWSWIGRHELVVPEAASLFEDVQITTVPVLTEQTGNEFNAYMRTTSLYARIPADRREELEAENLRVAERFGGVLDWTELAVLVTAVRSP